MAREQKSSGIKMSGMPIWAISNQYNEFFELQQLQYGKDSICTGITTSTSIVSISLSKCLILYVAIRTGID